MVDKLYDTDFEKALLKLLCINFKFASELGVLLEADYFDSESHKHIFNVVMKYIATYEKELDMPTLLREVDDWFITRGQPTAADVVKGECKEIFKTHIKCEQYVMDRTTTFCRRQAMKQALLSGVDILEKDGQYEQVLKEVDGAVSIGTGQDEGLSFDDLLTLPVKYRKIYNSADLVRTGIPSYDRALMGGLAPGELHVVQAPPKTGKTSLGANIGSYAMASGKVVFHITLEVSDLDLMAKYATRLTDLTYKEALFEDDKTGYFQKISKLKKYDPKLFVKYWTGNTVNALHLRAWISRIRSKTSLNPDLIIVDYDDLLLPIGGVIDDMYQNAGKIYDDLKQLADYFKAPILTFAQPQRHAWYKANNGELIYGFELAHSAKKAHKAWSISSINFAEGDERGILFVDMNRRGESHVKIPLKADLSRGQIREDTGAKLPSLGAKARKAKEEERAIVEGE